MENGMPLCFPFGMSKVLLILRNVFADGKKI